MEIRRSKKITKICLWQSCQFLKGKLSYSTGT